MRELEPQDTVFVYGALRSGTTVLNLMLDGHPLIHNPGEIDYVFDFLDADPAHPTGWRYDRGRMADDRMFRDSGLTMPDGMDGLDLLSTFLDQIETESDGTHKTTSLTVHRNIHKIARIFPGIRVLHLLRDPRDVARSAVGMGWAGNSYFGIANWIDTETHWDIAAPNLGDGAVMSLKFEDLMADPVGHLTRIAEFHGVAYHDDMLAYPAITTYDAPDPALCEQWRKKATPREIGLIESRIAPLMAARGYPPEHLLPAPKGIGLSRLSFDNTWRRWRFNIRRFGFPLFAGRHLAKRLRLRGIERHLKLRQDQIINRNRK